MFPLSEGFVVVPLKFTSARMFTLEAAFACEQVNAVNDVVFLATASACVIFRQ